MTVLRVLAVVLGVAVTAGTLLSAVRTVVLPRAVPSRLGRAVFAVVRRGYDARLRKVDSFDDRDRVMATYGPLSLLALLVVWLLLVYAAFGGIFWALHHTWQDALALSGSSLFTLGFDRPNGLPGEFAAFLEAGFGLVLLALLITYLPSVYSAFKTRELLVGKTEVRAGSPPSGEELLWRAWVLRDFESLPPLWAEWEDWFVDIEESHTSFPALAFFRSPQPAHSWVTAAGAVLDAAALRSSVVDAPRDIDAELTIRAGFLALRRIATFFGLPFPVDPSRGDPISVRREEFDTVCARLAAAGVPLRPDRDEAWLDFAGWRVNYDAVLIGLAALVMAPYAPWSSDRSLTERRHRPPVLRTRRTDETIQREWDADRERHPIT